MAELGVTVVTASQALYELAGRSDWLRDPQLECSVTSQDRVHICEEQSSIIAGAEHFCDCQEDSVQRLVVNRLPQGGWIDLRNLGSIDGWPHPQPSVVRNQVAQHRRRLEFLMHCRGTHLQL